MPWLLMALMSAVAPGGCILQAPQPPTPVQPHPVALTPIQATVVTAQLPTMEPRIAVQPGAATVTVSELAFRDKTDLLAELGLTAADLPALDQALGVFFAAIRGELDQAALESLDAKCQTPTHSATSIVDTLECYPVVLAGIAALRKEGRAAQGQKPSDWLAPTKDWAQFRNKSFSTALDSARVQSVADAEDFFRFLSSAGAARCSYRETAIAVVTKAEAFLPDSRAMKVLDGIYGKAAPCILATDRMAEYLHQRVGLIRLARQDIQGARQALLAASQLPQGSERFRTLFWLGAIEQTRAPALRDGRFWQELVAEYPLEIHASIARHFLGTSPTISMAAEEEPHARVRQPGQWDKENLLLLLEELILSRGISTEIAQWHRFVLEHAGTLTPETTLALAKGASLAQDHFPTISFLSRYLNATDARKVHHTLLEMYYPAPFVPQILRNSLQIDPLILLGLIRQESTFQPTARSHANAFGLMQLLPGTARRIERVATTELFEPETNIRIGTKYFRSLMMRFHGSAEAALAAYNAGPNHVPKWENRYGADSALLFADLIPFRETRFYVSRILRNAYWYGYLLQERGGPESDTLLQKHQDATWSSQILRALLTHPRGTSGPSLELLRTKVIPSSLTVARQNSEEAKNFH